MNGNESNSQVQHLCNRMYPKDVAVVIDGLPRPPDHIHTHLCLGLALVLDFVGGIAPPSITMQVPHPYEIIKAPISNSPRCK